MPSANANGRTGSCPRGPPQQTRARRLGEGSRPPPAPARTSGAGRPRGHRWALRRGARGGNATLPRVPSAARWRLWPSRHPQPRARGRRGPACPSIRGGPARVAARSPFSLLAPRRQRPASAALGLCQSQRARAAATSPRRLGTLVPRSRLTPSSLHGTQGRIGRRRREGALWQRHLVARHATSTLSPAKPTVRFTTRA